MKKWMEDVINSIEEMEDEIVEFLRDLIKIPTENPPGTNYKKFAEFFGKRLEEFGYNVQYIEVPPERFEELVPFTTSDYPRINIYAELNTEKPKPVLHFNGHFDVVPAGQGWSVDPFGGVIKDGKVYGRGASDQKSGLVAQVYAVEAIKRAGYKLNGKIEHSAVCDEETVGNRNAGTYYLVEKGIISKSEVDYVVITECLDPDRICLGHRGALRFEITVYGKQAHGCMPYLGINAGMKMAKLLNIIEYELAPRLKERVTPLSVVPEEARKASISLGTLHAGEATNLVPSRAVATFDRRLNPEENLEIGRREIYEICKALSLIDPEFKYSIRELYATDPVLVPKDQRLVKIFQEAIKYVYNKEPDFVLSPGTDDQRFIVHNAGIDSCIVYGPGRLTQAHVVDEHISIEDLLNGVKVMAIATGMLLGVSR